MKRAMLILALMLVSTGAALAQLGDTTVRAQVPFDFVVSDKAVPAGEWTVTSVPIRGAFFIQNADAKVAVFSVPQIMDETKGRAGSCVLVFHRYNNRYFLSEIKIEGSTKVYRLPKSRTEAELQAQNVTAIEEVVVASLK